MIALVAVSYTGSRGIVIHGNCKSGPEITLVRLCGIILAKYLFF